MRERTDFKSGVASHVKASDSNAYLKFAECSVILRCLLVIADPKTCVMWLSDRLLTQPTTGCHIACSSMSFIPEQI